MFVLKKIDNYFIKNYNKCQVLFLSISLRNFTINLMIKEQYGHPISIN